MSFAQRMLVSIGLIAVATFVAARLFPSAQSVVTTIGVLGGTAVALLMMLGEVRKLPAAGHIRGHARRPRNAAVGRPGDLERFEAAFDWQAYSRADFDYRLRGELRRLMRFRLIARRRVDIDEVGPKQPDLLPQELAWIVSRDEWPWGSKGLRSEDLGRIVFALERL